MIKDTQEMPVLKVCPRQQRRDKEINTVDSRYLDYAYLEYPLISKWKSGPSFNMEFQQKVTKNFGKEEKLLHRSNFSSFSQYFQHISSTRSQIT